MMKDTNSRAMLCIAGCMILSLVAITELSPSGRRQVELEAGPAISRAAASAKRAALSHIHVHTVIKKAVSLGDTDRGQGKSREQQLVSVKKAKLSNAEEARSGCHFISFKFLTPFPPFCTSVSVSVYVLVSVQAPLVGADRRFLNIFLVKQFLWKKPLTTRIVRAF